MEEQRMVRGKRLFRAGLLEPYQKVFFFLFFVLFAFCCPALNADDGEILELQIETSPADPIVYSPWSVYIIVRHPSPREVNVEPPRFPSSLALERVRADVRTSDQGERWTRVEYLFTPLRAETISLEPFEVRTPLRRGFSSAITVTFREESSRRRYEPRFRWLGSAPSIFTGEKGELLLELINWDPVMKIPQGFFQGKAPLNAILEEGLPYEVREGVYRYAISLIPLESSAVKLESVLFYSDIYTLTIPEITVPVITARPVRSNTTELISRNEITQAAFTPDEIVQDQIENDIKDLPFPAAQEKVFFLFRAEYRQVIAKAQILWMQGRRAEALAELRRNERDSLFGPLFIPLRKEVENLLGFGFTENESWHPLKIPLALWVVFGFLFLSVAAFLFFLHSRGGIVKINTAFRKRGGFTIVIALIFIAILAFIFLEESLGFIPGGRPGSSGKTAILRETQGYRIPDVKGAVNDLFEEGQPVIVGDYRGSWCFAETPDGRSGWVPSETVIPY